MARFLRISGGVPRSFDEASSNPIYDEELLVVSSGASGENEINGPISAGTSITLPNSGTYEGEELEIFVNKFVQEDVLDFNYVGSGTKTQVQFTFDMEVDDVIVFRKTRNI